MLVLSRKETESIRIGDDIVVRVVKTGGTKIKLGIEAPPHIPVLRGELTSFELDCLGVMRSSPTICR